MATETKTATGGIISGVQITAALNTAGTINAGAVGTLTITVPGLLVGMIPQVTLRSALDVGLVMAQPPWVSAANTLKLAFLNPTGSNITPAANITCDLRVP